MCINFEMSLFNPSIAADFYSESMALQQKVRKLIKIIRTSKVY